MSQVTRKVIGAELIFGVGSVFDEIFYPLLKYVEMAFGKRRVTRNDRKDR